MNYGGIETLLMNLYRNINRESVQFDFLVTREPKGAYDDEIVSLGGRIYNIAAARKVGLYKFREAVNGFFRSHKEYDCVHCHMNSWSGFFLPIAKKNGVKVRVAHSHIANPDYSFGDNLIKGYWKRKIDDNCTHKFACSKDAGRWLFGKSSNFCIINNSIDTKLFLYNEFVRSKLRIKYGVDDRFVIGHIGRFNKQKNHTFLLKVFNEIKSRKENSLLFLVGDGELKQEIENEAVQLNISDNIIFAGTSSKIHELLQLMDVFVFPSLYEGLGIVAIEAQAAGLPCIVSNTVPKEAHITDLIKTMALDETPKAWGDEIIKYENFTRESKLKDIIRSGYDIINTAKYLENFYLSFI